MQHWFDNVILDNWIKSIFHVKIKLDAIVAPQQPRNGNKFYFSLYGSMDRYLTDILLVF